MHQPQKSCSSSREVLLMQRMSSSLNSSQIPPLPHQIQNNPQIDHHRHHHHHHLHSSHFDQNDSHDDFFDQMLSTLPPSSSSWSDDLISSSSSSNHKSHFLSLLSAHSTTFDDSSLLASRLRHQQITGSAGDIPSQLLLSRGGTGSCIARSPSSGGDSGLLPLPLSLGSTESSDSAAGEGPVLEGLYSNGFAGSLPQTARTASQQQFHQPQTGSIPSQNYGTPTTGMNQAAAPVRQRVRARRGHATDPHSIAERLRRERIAERMKALQELVPSANKTDKASMLDEIIDYVKFLQLQVKVLSMSRLGGAAAVAPLMADINSSDQAGQNRGMTASSNDVMTVTEHQVAKLMDQDMGSAMQYLQGKGLCLMPISLATAMSTATSSLPRAHNLLLGTTSSTDHPPSPSISVLTAQSAMGNGGGGETYVKDAASVSKP